MPRMRMGLVVLVSLAVAPRFVLAEGPAFDCAKAQGEVEQLVCKDEGLAALDRKLDGVYKAAQAKARANEVVATFFETDPPAARLERGDQTVTAWLVPAASGAKYEGRNVELWTKGPEASVTWLDERLKCVSR